jgi:hypothetical protein
VAAAEAVEAGVDILAFSGLCSSFALSANFAVQVFDLHRGRKIFNRKVREEIRGAAKKTTNSIPSALANRSGAC